LLWRQERLFVVQESRDVLRLLLDRQASDLAVEHLLAHQELGPEPHARHWILPQSVQCRQHRSVSHRIDQRLEIGSAATHADLQHLLVYTLISLL
jgi:hypothetical protein